MPDSQADETDFRAGLRRDAMELASDGRSNDLVGYCIVTIHRDGTDRTIHARRYSWHGAATVGEMIGALEVAKRRLVDEIMEYEREL
jgi:hypothetical protein